MRIAETPIADRPSPLSARTTLIALLLTIVGTSSMAYFHLGLFIPRVLEVRAGKGLGTGYSFGNDFYPIWLTSQLWLHEHRDPYSEQTTRDIQTGLFGRPLDARIATDPPTDYRTFSYPAFTNLLFWPTAWVEFPALRIILAILLLLLTVCSVWLWMLALEWRVPAIWLGIAALLTLCNYPVLEALFAEQPGLIVGFLLAASAACLRRDKLLLAGVLLALTTIKPQMTLLAILYLLVWSLADWSRRKKLMIGFSAAMLPLLAGSLLIWPHWIGQWIKIVFGYHRYATPPLAIELMGPVLGARIGLVAVAGLIFASLLLMGRNRRAEIPTAKFWLTLSLLLAITSVTLLPGQAIYDHVILLPGIFLLIQYRRQIYCSDRAARMLQIVGGTTLVWPWVAACVLILARPLLSPERFYSTAIFALPIRTAGSFPFVVLALLILAGRVIANRSSAGRLADFRPGPSQ